MDTNTNEAEPPEANFHPPNNIPLLAFIPKTEENQFFYENGLAKFIDKIFVKTHHQIDECHFLWEKFSPNRSIFNLWEFRYAWYLGFGYQPFFYTLYLGKRPLATLPLWFNRRENRYEWFGGTWPEDNHFFVDDEKFIPFLFKIAPQPIFLNAIVKKEYSVNGSFNFLKEDTPKYVLKIEGDDNIETLISRLDKKHRHNLRHFYHYYQSFSPQLEILEGDQSRRLTQLRDLSIIDFERKDVSEYRKKERVRTFEMIYKLQGRYKILSLLIYIQNYLAAFDILGIYEKNFYILTGASDLSRFPGISVFITYVEFQEALKRKMAFIDCMQEDYNWKHKYFFPQPMLKFEIK